MAILDSHGNRVVLVVEVGFHISSSKMKLWNLRRRFPGYSNEDGLAGLGYIQDVNSSTGMVVPRSTTFPTKYCRVDFGLVDLNHCPVL